MKKRKLDGSGLHNRCNQFFAFLARAFCAKLFWLDFADNVVNFVVNAVVNAVVNVVVID